MATKIKTLDEAKEAVKTEKGNVKEAKKALTDYYKENCGYLICYRQCVGLCIF